jgi:hypothetical protein
MQVNGEGQNIAKAGGGGGNLLGQILGGLGNARAQKQKFELQKQLMDYSHTNKLKEIAFKGILGAHTNAATIEMGSDALSKAYEKHYGEGWQDVLKTHIRQGGLNDKGVIGPRANIASAEYGAERAVKNKEEEPSEPKTPVNGWNPEFEDISSAVKEHNAPIKHPFVSSAGNSGHWTPTSFDEGGAPTYSEVNADEAVKSMRENPGDSRTSSLNDGMNEGKY